MTNIGIVVPVYNVEKYLQQCVESILNQTFKDFQLILVDDGSKDRSGALCDELEKTDRRIRVIHKTNGGLSDARNCGIEAFDGEYIMFVDSDDLLVPDMLENLCRLMETYHADIACCGYVRCEDEETLQDVKLPAMEERCRFYEDNRMEKFLSEQDIATIAWAKLYKASLFKEIRYPVGKYHEDVFTTYQLIHAAGSVATTNLPGYVYRKNPGSISQKFSPKRFHAIEGKLRQAEFIEKHYPQLCPLAYKAVIYACNQCVMQMGQAGYRSTEAERGIQKLYRTYAKYYLRSTSTLPKKIYTFAALLNVRLAAGLSKWL